jgi:Holliday junction DNA helicase RuvA
MISYLTGTIKNKNIKSVTLIVNDIGYEIFVSQPVLEKLKVGENKEFFTHLHVREDAMELYGFLTQDEKKFFELLISVSGIGPKSALSVLSIAKLMEIKKAILRGDPSLLRKVSGIGQKIAERIVVELKNKLEDLPLGDEKINLSATGSGAFEALQGLGYSAQEVRDALRQVPENIENEDEMIKVALKALGKKKQ